jgi:hypothetical protein
MNGEVMKESATLRQHYSRSPRLSRNEPISEKSKEEASTYNSTTDDALARPAASDWLCKYGIWTKESIRNVSCEFFTEHFLPTNELTGRTFFSIAI